MGLTSDLGHRIELVSMDPHFHNITIALHRQQLDGGPAYLINSYSGKEGASDRIAFIRRAMETLGGMVPNSEGLLQFPCGDPHGLACRRLFLEACKVDPESNVSVRSLAVLDKKSGLEMVVNSLGDGFYNVSSEGESKKKVSRVSAVTGGLMKLGEMHAVEAREHQAAFPCGHAHDALVGVLLVRAPNVRAALREQELAAVRGVLASPSQQR
jgi:hypothetical protein